MNIEEDDDPILAQIRAAREARDGGWRNISGAGKRPYDLSTSLDLPRGNRRAGQLSEPRNGGNAEAQALYSCWSQFLARYKISIPRVTAAWAACAQGAHIRNGEAHTRGSVASANYQLNEKGLISALFSDIAARPDAFFGDLERQLKQAITPDDKTQLVEAINAALATKTAGIRGR